MSKLNTLRAAALKAIKSYKAEKIRVESEARLKESNKKVTESAKVAAKSAAEVERIRAELATAEATHAENQAALDTAKLDHDKLAKELAQKIGEVKPSPAKKSPRKGKPVVVAAPVKYVETQSESEKLFALLDEVPVVVIDIPKGLTIIPMPEECQKAKKLFSGFGGVLSGAGIADWLTSVESYANEELDDSFVVHVDSESFQVEIREAGLVYSRLELVEVCA